MQKNTKGANKLKSSKQHAEHDPLPFPSPYPPSPERNQQIITSWNIRELGLCWIHTDQHISCLLLFFFQKTALKSRISLLKPEERVGRNYIKDSISLQYCSLLILRRGRTPRKCVSRRVKPFGQTTWFRWLFRVFSAPSCGFLNCVERYTVFQWNISSFTSWWLFSRVGRMLDSSFPAIAFFFLK